MTTLPDPAPPRWARRAAHIAALTPLLSGLWRTAGAFGIPLGFARGSGLHQSEIGFGESAYLVGLSVLAECLGLLTLGLVSRWGEVVPAWVPLIGGRRVPRHAATVPALLGAAVLTAMSAAALTGSWTGNISEPEAPQGAAFWVMTACYAPMLAWGPLLGAVAVAYHVRRSAAVPGLPAPAPAA